MGQFEQEELILDEKEYLVGTIVATFFENPSNFYKVMLIRILSTNTSFKEKEIVVTGNFGQIQEEETYRFFGHFVDHVKYGKQYAVESYQQERPNTASGIIAYLSSDKFPGIGKKTAENIVETLGEQAIDRMIEDPSLLDQVSSLNEKRKQTLLETLRLNYGMEKVILGLNQYGFGNQISLSIYQHYQEETMEIIQSNPYQLIEDIEGIGFKRADHLAEQLGYRADAPMRIQAAVLHELLHCCLNSGDTYVEAEDLLKATITTLEKSRPYEIIPEKVAQEIICLVEEGRMMQEGTKLYEKSLFFSEWGIATGIKGLLANQAEISYDEERLDKEIRKIEKKFDILYGKSQVEAIKAAIQSPLFILTGGPGTGKTTVINGLVHLYAELNDLSLDPNDYKGTQFPVLLAAPTGRAAKRMNETTGLPASTIHRMLGLTGREKNTSVQGKELEGGLLIVDEMSMLDTWLANTLFKSISHKMQVILVGDKDQLPSVGPGQVLHDFLAVPDIPQKELTEIYRQEDGSTIVSLAHEIKEGHLPADFTQNQKDRSFFQIDAYQIEQVISQVVTRAKEKGFSAQDVQVLAPMYRGVAGIDAINKMMQEIFNPNDTGRRKEVVWNDKVYRIGDKVLQLVNTPELNVFNGDMGVITGITLAKEHPDKVDELTIEFDSGEVQYSRNEWNKITLSYCCSIHKSQGSEFKMVILPMVHQYHRMLQRNLLYTAITRSKELLILMGEVSAFEQCVHSRSIIRKTSLKERILGVDEMTVEEQLRLEAFENELLTTDAAMDFEQTEKPQEKNARMDAAETEEIASVEKNQENQRKRERTSAEISLFDFQQSQEKEENKLGEEEPMSYRLTLEKVDENKIPPMIGMDGVTPYQFM